MKVLSISTDRKLFEDGSAVLQRSLEYSAKMQELHIVVFSLKSHDLEFKKIDNLHIHSTNSKSRLFYFFDALRISRKIIIREGFSPNSTVITCQDPFETGLVGYFLKKKFHLPLQLQIHTDFLSSYFTNNVLNKIRVFIASFVIPKADGLRVVSSVILDSLRSKFPNLNLHVDILPIFVDVERIFRFEKQFYTPEKIPNSVFVASRFTKEKRIDVAIEAFKKVITKDNNAQMTIIGDGPERKNIERKIRELNLGKSVNIEVWNNDVPENLYKKAEVFLLTSEFEGYGMTLIEAGAVGCSIVTTKVGIAQTGLFRDGFNAHVCPVGDVECLSEKLIDLITNEQKRKLFKERMQDSIRGTAISREEYVDRYVDLLKKLIKNV
ncbi:MAG: poly(glycerol-phosphate) alpha-glucosyltransferase [Parcubacteria bacterium C7867-003]|nr:MAG: poly(glycerol-phosphate) alpha-glucosyltransferase [Parcubacteria bacterium C7867-003]